MNNSEFKEHIHVFIIKAYEILEALNGSADMLLDYVHDTETYEPNADPEEDLMINFGITATEMDDLLSTNIDGAVRLLNNTYREAIIVNGSGGDSTAQMVSPEDPIDALYCEMADSLWNYIVEQTLVNEMLNEVEPNWTECIYGEAKLMYGGDLAVITTVRQRNVL